MLKVCVSLSLSECDFLGIECVEGECVSVSLSLSFSEYEFIGIDQDFVPAGVMQKKGIECVEYVSMS